MVFPALVRLLAPIGRSREEAGIHRRRLRPSPFRGGTTRSPGFSSFCAEEESPGRDLYGVVVRTSSTRSTRSSPSPPPPFNYALPERLRTAGFHGLQPAEVAASIKFCIREKRPRMADQIHAVVVASGLGRHTMVCNALVNLYCKKERLGEALKIFHAMPLRDVVSWNTVLSGLPRGEDALLFAAAMTRSGFAFDAVTFTAALAHSSDLDDGDIGFGLQLHSRAVKSGFQADTFVGNALISAYGKAGRLGDAGKMFDEMPERDLVSWNALISGYAQEGEESSWGRAMEVFAAMTREGLMVDHVSLSSAIAACGHERSLLMGRQVHAVAVKRKLDKVAAVSNVLMSMYAKCGSALCSRRIFQLAEERNVVSWTTRISISDAGNEPPLDLFREMLHAGVQPNVVTFVALISALTASAERTAPGAGELIHGFCIRTGAAENVNVCNSLVTMYARGVSSMDNAKRVFEEIGGAADAVSWNALIAGYAQNRMCEEALSTFSAMVGASFCRPNEFTLGSVVSAVASAEAAFCALHGLRCHGLAFKMGLAAGEHLAGALIDMYSKRGSVECARKVFDEAPNKSLIAWTAVISAEARHANYTAVVALFEAMVASGVVPDEITFLAVLTACGHGGMVDTGLRVFETMVNTHGVRPTEEHYSAVVDMLGRAGRLEEAEKVVGAMPGGAGLSALQSLLGACRVHGNAAVAARAADALLGAAGEAAESGTYVLLSNIYAAMGQWEKVAEVRKAMRDGGVRKEVGFSWVDCGGGGVHRFSSADESHPLAEQVHWMAWFLGLQMRPFAA